MVREEHSRRWRMSNILVLQSGLPSPYLPRHRSIPVLDSNGNVIGLQPGSGDFNGRRLRYDLPNAPAKGSSTPGSPKQFLRGIARRPLPRARTRTQAIWAETASLVGFG